LNYGPDSWSRISGGRSKMVQKTKLSKKQLKYIESFVVDKLANVDLRLWQASCKSLAPPNYDHVTRTQWFEENKFRAEIGKKVVDFVEKIVKKLQSDKIVENIRVSVIRSAVVKGVRKAEQAQGISKYLLNDVKLSTLQTIVRWVEYPERPRSKARSIEKARRGRKKEKGKHRPPIFDIVREWEILTNETIRITSVLSNNYLHPYQNVDLEIDFSPYLTVTSITPYSWRPDEKIVRVGFLEAGLGVDQLETEFTIELSIRERRDSYPISCRVHFDNCDRGVRDVSEESSTTISLV
jgi:hypothetical protein